MEAGEFGTVDDLAAALKLGDRHVNRLLRLAYLAPEVLKRLVCSREITALTMRDLCFLTNYCWNEQIKKAVVETA